MTLLLGFLAFATDVGTLFYAKREMQTAADAGAIAAAAEINYTDMTAAARADTAQNGFSNGVNGTTVTVNSPPLYGSYAGLGGYVEVIVSQPQPTFFMPVFGALSKHFNGTTMTVSSRAVATNGPGAGCIYTLGTSGTDIGVTGNADISVPTCGIVDDSSSGSALSLTGNVTLDAKSIGIVGGASETGNVTVTPTPVTGIIPSGDPLAYLTAPTVPAHCTNSISLTGNQTQTLSQGCYAGISATGNSALTISAGTYIVNGNLTVTGNASITGASVTLDLLGSTSLTGNISMNLTAPTSGAFDGILFYQPSTNTNSISLTGNSGASLQGIVYAPAASVTLTGNSGSSIYTDFVVSSLSLVGNASFQDYAQINGSVLSIPKLVE